MDGGHENLGTFFDDEFQVGLIVVQRLDFVVDVGFVVVLFLVERFDLVDVAAHLEDVQDGAGGDGQILADLLFFDIRVALDVDVTDGGLFLDMEDDAFAIGIGLDFDARVIEITHGINGPQVSGERIRPVDAALLGFDHPQYGIRFDALISLHTDIGDQVACQIAWSRFDPPDR